jgi:hypothetical protein
VLPWLHFMNCFLFLHSTKWTFHYTRSYHHGLCQLCILTFVCFTVCL